jgi:hypothetical protein
MGIFDIDKTLGESRWWQIVGALILMGLFYVCVFVF